MAMIAGEAKCACPELWARLLHSTLTASCEPRTLALDSVQPVVAIQRQLRPI